MTYKATIRIPTEQYAYIEIELEGTPDDIMEAHRDFTDRVKPAAGIDRPTFRNALDRYLCDGTGETALYLEMGTTKVFSQQDLFQEIKLAYKRIEARNGKLKAKE